MTFEYDVTKSRLNTQKHGIDFERAKSLWDDPYAIELVSLASEDEERFLVLGRIDEKHYTAIVTHRGEAIRIISVRRSRKKEVAYYESSRTGSEV